MVALIGEPTNIINQTKAYLQYIEEHYNNVQKAWHLLQEKGNGKCFDFLYDDHLYFALDAAIKNHDKTKLLQAEFVPYRMKFYPTIQEKKEFSWTEQLFESAWINHLANNDHHWETWTKKKEVFPNDISLCVVHNVVDWMAMGMKFGDTAQSYYEANKKTIKLPKWAVRFMYEIFEAVYA